MIIHPTFRTLCRYVEDVLPERARGRVDRHRSRCARCRASIEWLAALGHDARHIPAPTLPDRTWSRIVERRAEIGSLAGIGSSTAVDAARIDAARIDAAGIDVAGVDAAGIDTAGTAATTPAQSPARTARRRWLRAFVPASAAAMIVLALAAIGLFLSAPGLEAERSELRLEPAAPKAGDVVRVEYRATSRLAGNERLLLRARVRTAERGSEAVGYALLGELARADGRVYRGAFLWPDSVVYAVLAVEAPDASALDHNGEQWDVLLHGDDGRPTFDALVQRAVDIGRRDMRLGLDAARALARSYPNRLESRFLLYGAESSLASRSAEDSLRAVHRAGLAEVVDHLERAGTISPFEMTTLVLYARAIGDTSAANAWRDRLIREHPTDPATIPQRVAVAIEDYRGRPGLFDALERLWEEVGGQEVGGPSSQLPISAFMIAQQRGDAAAMRRWAPRLEAAYPGLRFTVAQALIETPSLREEGVRRVRALIGSLDDTPGAARRLTETAGQHRARLRRAEASLFGQLGRALVESGFIDDGLAALDRAIESAWDVSLFRAAAEARLSRGDTAAALPVLARVAADPASGTAFVDSVRERLGTAFDPAAWGAALAEAEHEMRVRTLSLATDLPVRGRVRLLGRDGDRHTIDPGSESGTVVAFWSRYCTPSLLQLPQLDRVAAELDRLGVRVITVTDEPPTPDLDAFLQRNGYTFPVYHDVNRDARLAFDNFATPTYIVLDPAGRIRFESHTLDAVVRQVVLVSGP